MLGKRYTQALQDSVAQILQHEIASGTSPLDGTQSEAEVTQHLRERYATAEAFEAIKSRAELKRDFDIQGWRHRGEGWMDGSHWSMPIGTVPDLDYYIQAEIEEESRAGRTLTARPSAQEFEARTHEEFDNGPIHTTQKALDEGWNLSKVDPGQKEQHARIDSGRPKRR